MTDAPLVSEHENQIESLETPNDNPAAPSPDTWHNSIEDPALRQAAERFATPADLVQAHGALRRKLSNAILPPGDDASDDELADFRAKLGVPETPDAYDAAVPKDLPARLRESAGMEANLGEFLSAMHQAGAPKPVVDAALGWYWGAIKQMDGAATAAQKEDAQAAEASLRKEWGEAYGRNKSLAERAMENFLGEDAEGFRKIGRASCRERV